MDKDQMHVDQIKELLKNHKKEAILLRPLDEDLVEEKEAIERCKKKRVVANLRAVLMCQ